MNIKNLCVAVSALLVVSCGSSPDCGSSATEKLVQKIVKDNQSRYGNLLFFSTKGLTPKLTKEMAEAEARATADATAANAAETEKEENIQKELSPKLVLLYSQCVAIPQSLDGIDRSQKIMKICSITPLGKDDSVPYNDRIPEYQKLLQYEKFVDHSIRPVIADAKKQLSAQINPKEQGELAAYKVKMAAYNEAWRSSVKASLANIVMTAKDTTTGAVNCKAQLTINVPDWASVEQPIRMRLEKNTDGDLVGVIQ